jgi:hypothetical protein
MKKLLSSLGIFLFLLNLSFDLALSQEKLQEEITVIAVEVPVRVIHKGQVVKGLIKENFEIYENGVKQEITSFKIISRKMSAYKEEAKAKKKKRLFILIFNVFDYNEAIEEGIDYFFQNIFHKEDRLFILTENRIINIEMGKDLSTAVLNLKKTLKEYKLISSQSTLQALKNLNDEAEKLLNVLQQSGGVGISSPSQALLRYCDNYQRIWLEYKKKYITPDVDRYRSLINRIKMFEGEKWAICFQQREIFPRLKSAGRLDNEIRNWLSSQVDSQDQVWSQLIQTRQVELQRSFDISESFPSVTLRDLFIEANATFHLILLKSFRHVLSQDFELMEVSQDYEDCLKKISSSTGGSYHFLNKVPEALQEAANSEDYYYLLVYSPKEDRPEKKREIEVKVKKSGVDIIYLKHVPRKEAPPITITNFEAGQKAIKFLLINYKMTETKEKLMGAAEVKITLFDKNSNKVYDEAKTLSLFKREARISLNFDWLNSGSYFLIIQAMDKLSSQTDVFSIEVEF